MTSSTFSDLFVVYVQQCMKTWKCEKSTMAEISLQMHFTLDLLFVLLCITVYFDRDTDLHSLVELVRRGEDVDVGAWQPEGGYVLCYPSEVRAEAACALSSGWTSGLGDASGGWVSFGQQRSQQQYGGAGGNMEIAGNCFCVCSDKNSPAMFTSLPDLYCNCSVAACFAFCKRNACSIVFRSGHWFSYYRIFHYFTLKRLELKFGWIWADKID